MSTLITIDLDALTANYRYCRDRVAPAGCAAVVKADAYGLGLARIALGKGRHRYVLPAADLPENAYEELKRQFGLFVRDVDRGGNLLVVKTAEGHASGIAYLLDRLRRDEIVGTLAGDDTILVVARTEEAAQALEDEFAGLLVEGRALRRALSGS